MTPEEIEALMRGAQPEDGEIVRSFVAAYESQCLTCSETIEPGDHAGYVGDDDQASCSECCDRAKHL